VGDEVFQEIQVNDKMGPLPEPAWFAPQMISEDAYSEEQMRIEKWYGFLEGVMFERERCARLCEETPLANSITRILAARIRNEGN
jgi:hypothetical protein